ncbi:N-acetyl-alpha-D-glucosaminyl-diphospho-ditrans, octacis-undecaprenol 4-epimerase [Lachnospiraceae bacterium]|nr:N-acetyl-alpha-D-glucosaminyl-diphospho-ditrans, octacis-undecaprenol 4-epimerase [Lachnospiraceae bacterium]
MKRILIAGANSYIGTSLERYLLEYNASQGRERYRVDTISQRDSQWEDYDFRGYDAVFQASGIAHVDTGAVKQEQQALYYRVNCDLAAATARKARAAGVGLFIYPSSIIVYGDSAPYGKSRMITRQTPVGNSHFYGHSKIRAEEELRRLESEAPAGMQVAILRLPMVYGRGSRGNYPLLAKLADRLPFFPNVRNQRSMIYIENLCEFLRQCIEEGRGGLYFPQNPAYTSTSQMVREIAAAHGKKLLLLKVLNPLVALASRMPGRVGVLANKAFGSLTYDREMSGDMEAYCLYSLEESIRRTEG